MEAHKYNNAYNALVGNQASSDFDEALATCNWLPSVLDNGILSLNASVMEDIIENDEEQVNKYHKEGCKGFTPNTTHTNIQLDMSRI